MSQKGKSELAKVQKRTALRVASAYCTVSADAVLVLTDMPSIDLVSIKRQKIFKNLPKEYARKKLLSDWQTRWDSASTGRCTHRFIPKLDVWFHRKSGEVNYRLTQALSGPGCFAAYLHRFGKLDFPAFWYCDHESDDVYPTFFVCDAWHSRCSRMNMTLRIQITPENMTEMMLSSKEAWTYIDGFVNKVMHKKEVEERKRQKNARLH